MIREALKFTPLFLTLAAISACDDAVEEETSFGGSCHHTADSFCQDYSGEAWVPFAIQTMCAAAAGYYSAEHCPADNQIGTCIFEAGAEEEYRRAYYSPDIDADAAESECALNGGEWM